MTGVQTCALPISLLFPSWIIGGPDGLTPQHINDFDTGTTDANLLQTLTDLVNLLLAGSYDNEVNTITMMKHSLLFQKKDGGVWSIAIG